MEHLLGLMNAQCVSVHEVVIRLSLGKHVSMGHLQEINVTPPYGVPRSTGARQVEYRRCSSAS
jgi:hypothetical protein